VQHVAALTERAEILHPIVGRVAIQVRRCEHDARHPKPSRLHKIGPSGTRNVKRWSSPSSGIALDCSLLTTKRKQTATLLPKRPRPLNVIHGSNRSAKFNRAGGNSGARLY
jgi:hypothetical protein